MRPDFPAVLIPAFNERATIARIVHACRSIGSPVLVVDDGSQDDTASLAQQAGADVIQMDRNSGLGSALRSGLVHLRSNGYAYIVTLDGDGAHEPAAIPALWNAHLSEKADFTIGSRFLAGYEAVGAPSPKRAANRVATLITNMALGTHLTDVMSGVRLFGPKFDVTEITESGFGITLDFIDLSVRKCLHVNESPIDVRYDAREPFVTSQRELVDFLSYIAARALSSEVRAKAAIFLKLVMEFNFVHLAIQREEFYLHPLPSLEAYLFQGQESWFEGCQSTGNTSDFREVAFDDE